MISQNDMSFWDDGSPVAGHDSHDISAWRIQSTYHLMSGQPSKPTIHPVDPNPCWTATDKPPQFPKKGQKNYFGIRFYFFCNVFNEGHSILCIQWQMKLLAPQNLLQFCWEPVGLLGSKMMHWESKKVITTRITICIMDKTWDEWDMDLPMAKSPNHVEVWKQNATVSTAV